MYYFRPVLFMHEAAKPLISSTENFTLEFCFTQDPYTGGTLYSINIK